jgi:hypothetical protein
MNPPEKHESLWLMIVSPLLWAGHFLACYLTAAIWCAKYAPADGSLQPVRWAIAGYTAAALAGIAWNGWSGYRRHRRGGGAVPHDADTAADRHRFLGFATLLLAGLSAVATLFAGVVALFFSRCD